MRDAEQRCRLAGHTWKADTLGYCDGSATPNMPFEVLMDPCNGKICSVMLVERMTQASATAWLLRFRQLESDLAKRYGDPGQRILKIPTDCTTRIVPLISAPPGSPEQNSATVLTDAKGDDIFVRCMAAKRLDIRTIWGWETKHSVALYLQQLNSMGPSIVVNYMTPEASRSNRATGL